MEEQAVRYPKRKREQVSYFDSGVDSEEEYGEDMEEQGHLMKVRSFLLLYALCDAVS